MKILYHGAPPMADTGYGTCSQYLAPRINRHWDVSIQSVGGFDGMGIDWGDIHIYPSGAGKFGEQSIPYWFKKTESDVVFSHHDHWSMADTLKGIQESGVPMVLYTILDHDLPGKKAPESVVRANENALRTVVMSEWALERTRNSRIPDEQVTQIPHGVNTSKYAPVTDEISEEELKRDLGVPEDCVLFGMVAANYGPRKNIPNHMNAFKRLVEDYGADDAYLYIHAHPTMQGGYNLYDVREALGLSPERVKFPDPHEMYHGIDDLVVVQLYNTFDVHLNVTQSESWGLTITEALSSGTPVIAANNSAQTEQMGVPYDHFVTETEGFDVVPNGILVHRGTEMWTQNAVARRFLANVGDIYDAMVYAYENLDEMKERGENGRGWVRDHYQWDDLFEEEWKPLFEEVEEELGDSEYDSWYFDRREKDTQGQAFVNECDKIFFELKGDDVLDVGCGTGTLLEYLEEHGFEVTGVEYAEEGVERTEEKGIECYQGDIRDLQFKDDSFDNVVSQHVLEHVEEDVKALGELCRVAGERVVCVVPQPSPEEQAVDKTEVRRYDEEELERLREGLMEYAGYELEYERIRPAESVENWLLTVRV